MKICANCGTSVPDDAAFCNNCGSAMTETPAAETTTTASAAPSGDTNAANAGAQGQAAGQPAGQPVNQGQPAGQPVNQGQPVGQQPGAQQAPVVAPVPAANYQQPYGQAPYQQPQYQQPYVAFDPKDHTSEFDPQDIADNKLFAILPYLFSCIAGIIVGIYVKDSEFVKFHIKNAIRLDIAAILLLVVAIVPFIGWVVAIVGAMIIVVLDIMAIVWVLQGKAKEIPIISSIGFLK
ncbi:zinc-ribbon domain-containing protein [Butyrivibrio sp. CB08]|uniref:zinc-ribbon domain-containing protein n=1 Tax=Butyrivibrio sp. CB08 TaxID=2364879 RepID=UPI000EA855F6|nr:zinc-ribbon domain-containing protein [Butyrivibrio sp. CB08]RKM61912.1 zinc-ribbon domain-containing protein [Butyrivibrio sp. CB08]